MNEVTFGYTSDKIILRNINFDVGLDSRVAIVGANGAGKSTLYVLCQERPIFVNDLIFPPRIKILTEELNPMAGHVTRNGRLRVYVSFSSVLQSQTHSLRRGYFAQHHVDSLIPTMSPVQFLASKFPGKSEQEYRQHLGNFQISGMTGFAHGCSIYLILVDRTFS